MFLATFNSLEFCERNTELCNLSIYLIYLNGHALLLLTLVVTVRAPFETASLYSAAFDFYMRVCECEYSSGHLCE